MMNSSTMRAFIIRPFGTANDINFDDVEAKLIRPALERLRVSGRTTLDILKAGNILADMFQRLLTADLVIADVSIHDANVFYELGIRHALREKRTVMIRSDSTTFPFDLQTDRYFLYNKSNPAASLDEFSAVLDQTINSEHPDSPVFRLLPNLEPEQAARFLAVPLDFGEDVERIAAAGQLGDLELLANELEGFDWETEGLRIVGRTLFNLKAHRPAVAVWERVRQYDALDFEANRFLATSYQRLADLTRADEAVNRVLTRHSLPGKTRAEFYSLLGSNAKARWKAEWQGQGEGQTAIALSSGYLYEAYGAYENGFIEDLNHFYSGLNALALLRVIDELAPKDPETWSARFETEDESRRELEIVREKIASLAAAVGLSIRAEKERLRRSGQKDVWLEISEADLSLLNSKKPTRVAVVYRDALGDAPPFAIDSVRNQILIYKSLGIIKENVDAALSVVGDASPAPTAAAAEAVLKPTRILLFTGHMIDAPGRKTPRFPAHKEAVARDAIKQKIQAELNFGGVLLGIAGGASGGDILFHEVCAELKVPTELFLALPRDQYVKESVQAAGPAWVDRFDRILKSHPPRILSDARDEAEYLPRWLREKPGYSIWQRNNLWMLNNALFQADGGITLIALWDEKAGDGPGGTADVVQTARERGAKTVILNVNSLFDL
jgi:hypothetical protein